MVYALLAVLAFVFGSGFVQAATPDIVLITFSGRSGFPALGECGPGTCPPRDNSTYLSDPERRTVQTLQATFEENGLSVSTFNASSFIERHHSYLSNRDEAGYVEAEAFLLDAYSRFIKDRDDPARIVLVGHSHGAVWASLLAWNHPEVPIEYLVSLDSVCTGWAADHAAYVRQHYDWDTERYPSPLGATLDPCRLTFEGLPEPRAVSDVIPSNVRYNLEVQSAPFRLELNPEQLAEDLLGALLERPPSVADTEALLDEVKRRTQEHGQVAAEFLRDLRPLDLLDFARYRRDIEVFLEKDWREFLGLGVAAAQGTLNPLHDGVRNVRPTGETGGIFVYQAQRENHSEVTWHDSEAMGWVREALMALEEGRQPPEGATCPVVQALWVVNAMSKRDDRPKGRYVSVDL
jgi:pimeloyl-ACP methyl ester carboxylesterase